MKKAGILAVSMLISVLSVSLPQAAERLVLCEELYQED